MAQKVGTFCRVTQNLSKSIKLLLYKTIVLPQISYCPNSLLSANISQVSYLQKLQNKALRVVLNCSKYESVDRMHSTVDIMRVEDRIKYLSLIVIYKAKNELSYGFPNITIVNNVHDHITRGNSDIMLKHCQTKAEQVLITYKGFKLFNQLPVEIKEAPNLKEFKILCKNYLIIRNY